MHEAIARHREVAAVETCDETAWLDDAELVVTAVDILGRIRVARFENGAARIVKDVRLGVERRAPVHFIGEIDLHEVWRKCEAA
jgi:hypothetical protein